MTRRRLLTALLVGAVVLPGSVLGAGTIGTAAAAPQAVGEPDISVYVPQDQLAHGTTQTLTLQLSNSGTLEVGGANPSANQQVQTARGIDVTLDASGSKIQVKTDTVPLGSLPPGTVSPADFQIVVPEDTNPGEHTLEAEVTYKWTRTVADDGTYVTRTATEDFDVEVVVTDDARFRVVEASSDVIAGGSGETSLRLKNVGDGKATNTSVSIQSTSEDIRFGQSPSATQYVGEVPAGQTTTVTVDTTASPGATNRRYALQTTVSFEDRNGIPAQSGPLSFGISPIADGGLSLSDVSSTLAIGEQGTVSATFTNDGPKTLRDATIALQTNGETVVPVEPDQALGTVAPGESVDFEYPIRMADRAEPGIRQLGFVVNYLDDSDTQRQSDSLNIRVDVGNEQSFALSNVESTLRVGSEGQVQAVLANQGPGTIHDAVVRLQPSSATVQPQETEYAIGQLAPDEQTNVSFAIDVTSAASAGPRQLSLVVDYQNDDDEARQSDPLNLQAPVAPPQDEFTIEPVETTLEAGSSGTVRLSITNDRDVALSNINAKAFVDDPISAENDEAYVPELAPGESAEIALELSAGADAPGRPQPLEIDFQYDEPDGDTKLSDTYQMPLTVQESSGGGLSLSLIGVGIVLMFGLIGGVLYMRR